MDLPSKLFYEKRLKVGDKEKQSAESRIPLWNSCMNRRFMFVDVVGEEKTIAVATDECSAKSKYNEEEAEIAVLVR